MRTKQYVMGSLDMAKPDKVESFLNGVHYCLLGIAYLLIGMFTVLALCVTCYDAVWGI